MVSRLNVSSSDALEDLLDPGESRHHADSRMRQRQIESALAAQADAIISRLNSSSDDMVGAMRTTSESASRHLVDASNQACRAPRRSNGHGRAAALQCEQRRQRSKVNARRRRERSRTRLVETSSRPCVEQLFAMAMR